MKKIFLILLTTIIVFPNTAFAKFTDVSDDHPYSSSIKELEQEGTVKGYKNNTFKPDSPINRAEFVKIIIEAIKQSGEGTNCFTDVKNDWYAPYICKAKELGLINGNPDGNFLPGQDINLAEASKIITNALHLQSPLNEAGDEEWFAKYIKALENKGALPLSLASFDHKITRGEMAEMIVRAKSTTKNENSLTYESLKALTLANKYISESDLAKLKNVDLKTLTTVPTQGDEQVIYYLKDKNHVYDATDLKIREEFDPQTFEVNSFFYGPPDFKTAFIYGKTKDEFWYYTTGTNELYYDTSEIIIDKDIDASSFKMIDEIGFFIHEEAGYDTSNFVYKNVNICKTIEKEYADGTFSAETAGDFQKNEDGSCVIIKKEPRSAGDRYHDGFLAKDKNYVYVLTDMGGTLEKVENLEIDASSFEKVYEEFSSLFKDKNHIYIVANASFEQIQNADPGTFGLETFRGKYYLKDKDTVWTLDENGYSEIKDANPETFFDRKLPAGKKYLIVSESNYSQNSKQKSVIVTLDTGEVTDPEIIDYSKKKDIPSDLAQTLAELQYSALMQEGDLFFAPEDPKISTTTSQMAKTDIAYEKIDKTNIKDIKFEPESLNGVDEIKVGTTLLIKTLSGKIYRLKVIELYQETDEIVIEYAMVE